MPRKEKVCPKCGQKGKSTDVFCEICGTKLVVEKEEEKEEKETKKEKVEVKETTRKEKPKSKLGFYILVAALALVLGAALTSIYFEVYGSNNHKKTNNGIFKKVTVDDTGIADAVEKVYDSVVVVENLQKGTLVGTGSGFVYKEANGKGYILTNAHVTENATEIYVSFTDNRRVEAKLVGSDSYADVALLSVDAKEIISVAEIGDTEKLRLGDTTFAVGAPLDYELYSWTVTRGIISGKNRLVEVSVGNSNTADYVMKVLQTDTAINNGNSGGPLCNANGEVIGITNMKLASSAIEGMGFAIYIEDAINYAEMFIQGKTKQHPYLGIAMYNLADIKSSLMGFNINTDLTTGVYVYSVEEGSAADKAGLKNGDIIVKFDGQDIKTAAYLRYNLYQHEPGDKVEIVYNRNGKEKKTTVTLKSNSNL